jgi:glycosyltransferase involved in cell wall biosynthesis
MKVTISVGGKFHAFYLAKQLEKKGYLGKIFTSYPWFAVKDSDLPRDKVGCLVLKEILQYGLYKIPYLNRRIDIASFASNFFDKQVAKYIKYCDIFVGSSGYSLHTIRKIRKLFPAKVIIERVSSHIQIYRDILIQEQERLGINLGLSFATIEKELEEYRQADYIVVPSSFSRKTFLDKGFSEDKVISIPWGVDIDTFRPVPKNDQTFRIVCVGIRLIKGIHYLLQAIEELDINNLEVWLIGGRVDRGLLPFLRKYSRKFKYFGAIPQRKLYEYYSQGSLFVLFSLEDGFGMVVLEAMACGLPVICSDSVGAKDVVRDGIDGFIVATRNVEKLKEKILYLYENQHICREMGLRARRNVSKYFTWNNYGERVIKTYFNFLK